MLRLRGNELAAYGLVVGGFLRFCLLALAFNLPDGPDYRSRVLVALCFAAALIATHAYFSAMSWLGSVIVLAGPWAIIDAMLFEAVFNGGSLAWGFMVPTFATVAGSFAGCGARAVREKIRRVR